MLLNVRNLFPYFIPNVFTLFTLFTLPREFLFDDRARQILRVVVREFVRAF